MAGDNKILTVSFGTFSCTVEGFEDPLGTMREITEYFRDLSSEDRYFGAEPLTPEPEQMPMLADGRARARDQGRARPPQAAVGHVETGIDDADEMNDQETPRPPSAGQTASAEPPAPATPAAAPEEPAAPKADAAPPAAPQPQAPPADTAAGRLARIRAAAGPDLDVSADSSDEDEEDALEPGVTQPEPEIAAQAPEAAAHGPEPEPPDGDEDEEATPDAAEAPERNILAGTGEGQPHGAAAFEGNPIDAGGTADRIFREAGHALEDIEARRRHSAIAHLKAAVSATVNDRNILGWRKRQHEEEEVAYRADLAQAVKPEFAQDQEHALPGISESGEADQTRDDFAGVETSEPFVLGSDARVDPNSLAALALTEEDRVLEEETRPVRPRASNETFPEFAERMSARGLSELLEAAAAYSSQIEGRPQFSRPQIMKHVVALTGEKYSREDGLRSFGALLRQGRIQKLKRGIFVLTDNSRFAARPRLAGE